MFQPAFYCWYHNQNSVLDLVGSTWLFVLLAVSKIREIIQGLNSSVLDLVGVYLTLCLLVGGCVLSQHSLYLKIPAKYSAENKTENKIKMSVYM